MALARIEGQGALIGGAIEQVTETGGAQRQAAAVFAGLAGQLNDMAVSAAQREGEAAGLAAGAAAGLPEAPASAGVPAAAIDGTFVSKVKRVESGGNPNAKNPNSSAEGDGQFIDSTWLGLLTKYRPDLLAGKTQEQVLALRRDETLSSEMIGRLASENAEVLQSAGISTTEGNLYLGHFLGSGGARSVLLADPSTPVETILSPAQIKANGSILAGKTAGQVAAWAARKMGGGAPIEASVAPTGPTVAREGGGLALRNDGTAYGEAFDNAALRAHSWRLEAGLHEDLGTAYAELKDDPVALQARFREIHAGYVDDGGTSDPRMREIFNRSFTEKSLAYMNDARRLTELRRTQEAAAAAGTLVEAQRNDVERQAFIAGGQPNGDAILGNLTAKGISKIDAMVAARDLSPDEGEKQKRALVETATGAQIRGAFASQPDLAAKQRFAGSLLDQWKEGAGPIAALDFRQVSALADEFSAEVTQQRNAKSAETVMRKHELEGLVKDDIASVAASGSGVISAGKPLDAAEIGAILGPEKALEWIDGRAEARQLFAATTGMERLDTRGINARLAGLEPKPGEEGFAERQKVYGKARERAEAIVSARKADPAAAADAAFPQSRAAAEQFGEMVTADSFAAVVGARAAGQQALGLPENERRFLTKAEVLAFKAEMEASPDNAAMWAVQISRLPPEQSGPVLAQLFDDAPQLAVAADLVVRGGSPDTIRRLTQQQAVEREPGYKAPELKAVQAQALGRAAYGASFALFPAQESARNGLASKLFLSLSRERGTPLDLADPVAQSTYEEALQMAAGARISGGVQFGGIIPVNGAPTMVPTDMEAERLETVLHGITDADLAALGAPMSGNGVPVRASDIRSGRLVPVGDGVYRIAQDDPDGPAPRYAATASGEFWTLDIRRLAAMQLGRGPASRGVRNPVTGAMQ